MFKGLNPTSKKAVIATLIISLVLLFGSMTPPLLGYIFRSYPPPEYNPMLLLQIPAFVGMIVSFVIGPLALKVNLKILTVIATVAALIYFLIFLFVGSTNFTMLLVAACFMGITQGAAFVLTGSIFGAYVLDPLQRANFVAISGAILNGGAAVVNIIGGIVAAQNEGLNWNNAYWLGLLIVPALILFWIMMPWAPEADEAPAGGPEGHGGPGGPGGPPPPSGGIPPKVWMIIGMGLIAFLGMAVFLLNVGTYITEELGQAWGYGYTTTESGLANSIFTIFGVVAGFSFPIVVKFLKNWIAAIGYALAGVGLFFIMTFQDNIFLIYAGAGLCGYGFNVAMPFVMGQLMAITPPRLIPVVMSLNMGFMNLGMTFAPNIFGALGGMIDGFIATQLFIAIFFVAAAVVIAVLLFVVMKPKAPEGPPAEH